MSKRANHPNISAVIYDGVSDIICECPGELCLFARFYVDPPDPRDECIYCKTGQTCTWPPAREAAIAAAIKMLNGTKEAKK